MADPNPTESATEARRRKILEKGQERLKHITFGSGSASVSRSLDFGEEGALDRQPSLTPAASGLDPADGLSDGAAMRSKSWLAMQESPPAPRRRSTSDKSPITRRNGTPQASPLAPAHSASLAPVSSPAAAYASDKEPISPSLTRSGVSSATAVTSPPSLQASPQVLPMPGSGTPFASPLRTSQSNDGRAVYHSPGGVTSETRPGARVTGGGKQRRPASRSANLQQALVASSAWRAVLAAVCAVFLYANAPLYLATAWQQHAWQPQPGAAHLLKVPPLAALVGLQLAVIVLAHLLRPPSQSSPPAAPQDWRLAVRELSPRLHAVLSLLVPLYQQLWQDVAIYIFTIALCTEVGAPRYRGHWLQLHRFIGHHTSLIPPQWREAAGRWTL